MAALIKHIYIIPALKSERVMKNLLLLLMFFPLVSYAKDYLEDFDMNDALTITACQMILILSLALK